MTDEAADLGYTIPEFLLCIVLAQRGTAANKITQLVQCKLGCSHAGVTVVYQWFLKHSSIKGKRL
jgi:hypothetical protein